MRKDVRASKHEPLVDKVELVESTPHYAHVRLPDGRETTVSLRQLAPVGVETEPNEIRATGAQNVSQEHPDLQTAHPELQPVPPEPQPVTPTDGSPQSSPERLVGPEVPREHPQRNRRPPSYLKDYVRY
uniref:Uncharacterized protein n=1 Tax=Lygus hesperus TaxID=30085 RepID=A0A0K8SK20_LYGHE